MGEVTTEKYVSGKTVELMVWGAKRRLRSTSSTSTYCRVLVLQWVWGAN